MLANTNPQPKVESESYGRVANLTERERRVDLTKSATAYSAERVTALTGRFNSPIAESYQHERAERGGLWITRLTTVSGSVIK